MKNVFLSCITVILAGLVIISRPLPSAAAALYSIQTGTYVRSAVDYAKKQFDTLSKKLAEDDRHYLRIEDTGRYCVVRVGSYDDVTAAEAVLKRVRTLVSDAYIVKEAAGAKVLESYSADEKRAPLPAEYFSLLLGDFARYEEAKTKFVAAEKVIKGDDLTDLRVVKTGNRFRLMLGKFPDNKAAEEFRRKIGNIVPGVTLAKTREKDEEVLDIYKDEAKASRGDTRPAADAAHGARIDKEKEALDKLFADVSARFSDEDYGKAAELLRKGLAKWPKDPDLHAQYGEALLDLGYPEKAYEEYRRAADISPDVPDFHAGVGHSLLGLYMDKAKDSVEAFKKALDIDPNNVSALEGLGIVYVSINKMELAMQVYKHLRTVDKDAAARLNEFIARGVDWGELR